MESNNYNYNYVRFFFKNVHNHMPMNHCGSLTETNARRLHTTRFVYLLTEKVL